MGPIQGRPTRIRRRQDEVWSLAQPPTKALIEQYRRNGNLIIILLLGAGESGKSTVLKQMRILHGTGFSEEYRKDMKSLIAFNVIEGAHAVLQAMTDMGYQITDHQAKDQAELINQAFATAEIAKRSMITEPVAHAILSLLNYEPFKEALGQAAQFQIQDGWLEFAKQLRRYPDWGGPKWIPEQEDILLSRVRTTGVNQEYFILQNKMYEMIDVGGQVTERRKWFLFFEGVNAMIFVSSLSEYDQVTYERSSLNRLVDSITLWTNMSNNEAFNDSAIILFLNKFDLFRQKYYYKGVPIVNPLPDEIPDPPKREEEVDDDCDVALNWFRRIFKERVKGKRQMVLKVHVTTALDPVTMDVVINDCARFIVFRVFGQDAWL